MHALSRMLGYFASSPLPPKLAEQPTVDVALSEGDLPLAVEPSAVVLVGYLWASEGAGPGELPDAGWHLSNETHLDDGSSERAWKVRLTSVKHGLKGRLVRRPARRIAALNHSRLSALSGGFAAALWQRLGAPSRAPLLCWLRVQVVPLSPGTSPTLLVTPPVTTAI